MTKPTRKAPAGPGKILKKVRMILMDVDGVLTGGEIILGNDGQELKVFDVQDGMGLTLARYGGIKLGIITGRSSQAVARRAEELHLDALYQGVTDKMDAYTDILQTYDLRDGEVCYIGDDLLDITVMEEVGVAVAVANARQEVKDIADYVTVAHGGRGAVREVVEMILMAQKKWETVLNNIGLTTK
jgi:3-deoxy-D-manno-octulosonate 8-phosphate phosphatase (KDO 8-P phosphatase)